MKAVSLKIIQAELRKPKTRTRMSLRLWKALWPSRSQVKRSKRMLPVPMATREGRILSHRFGKRCIEFFPVVNSRR